MSDHDPADQITKEDLQQALDSQIGEFEEYPSREDLLREVDDAHLDEEERAILLWMLDDPEADALVDAALESNEIEDDDEKEEDPEDD